MIPKTRTKKENLGHNFNWLLGAYAVSTFGTMFQFGAFPIIAIQVLNASSIEVSFLEATGLIAGAIIALPFAPWVEFHRKKPVMIMADIIRFVALASIPLAYLFGRLSFIQLVLVAIIVAAGNIMFTAASGAVLKSIVLPKKLLVASSRFESTTWIATILGPPMGGAVVGLLGPVASIAGDAVSYMLSAFGVRKIHTKDLVSKKGASSRQLNDIFAGWRYIFRHPALSRLFLNSLLVNGLIMAPLPLIAILMLKELGFEPWQYGLAFALPCIGGLLGARLAPHITERLGEYAVLRIFGILRACWPIGLAFMWSGTTGLIFVMILQFCLVASMGIFSPVFAAYRMGRTDEAFISRMLAAWTLTNSVVTAILVALWGVIAYFTSIRMAIGVAGILLLLTPFFLPRRRHMSDSATLSNNRLASE